MALMLDPSEMKLFRWFKMIFLNLEVKEKIFPKDGGKEAHNQSSDICFHPDVLCANIKPLWDEDGK